MENKTNLIRIRVSDKEKKEIQEKAKKKGLDMSSYIRMTLLYRK